MRHVRWWFTGAGHCCRFTAWLGMYEVASDVLKSPSVTFPHLEGSKPTTHKMMDTFLFTARRSLPKAMQQSGLATGVQAFMASRRSPKERCR